jgi:hypothetical protein
MSGVEGPPVASTARSQACDALLARLRRESQRARTIRLRQAFWLERDDFKQAVGPLLAEFRARAGTVEYA